MLGAVIAVLGWVGKQCAEWFLSVRAEDRMRRARLTELLALVRAGDAAWQVQCENRDRLANLIKERAESLRGSPMSYDRLLAAAFPTMSPQEAELHAIVRSITVHTFQPLNQALLEWLTGDVEFRVHLQDGSPRGMLAKYLADLEAHLLLWHAKFRAWIPDHPERALVYLADEERHGVGFPAGGVEIIEAVLPPRSNTVVLEK